MGTQHPLDCCPQWAALAYEVPQGLTCCAGPSPKWGRPWWLCPGEWRWPILLHRLLLGAVLLQPFP